MSKQKEYIIEGMSCASCAMTIENAVSKMPGVDKASVNLATEIMTVEANDSVTPEDIAKVVDGVGYSARPRGKSVEEELEEKNEKKSVWGIILKVIIVVATAIGSAFGVTACI